PLAADHESAIEQVVEPAGGQGHVGERLAVAGDDAHPATRLAQGLDEVARAALGGGGAREVELDAVQGALRFARAARGQRLDGLEYGHAFGQVQASADVVEIVHRVGKGSVHVENPAGASGKLVDQSCVHGSGEFRAGTDFDRRTGWQTI